MSLFSINWSFVSCGNVANKTETAKVASNPFSLCFVLGFKCKADAWRGWVRVPRGRAAAACGGRAARQHGRLLNSRNRRMRGRFACAKRSAATAVQRRRTAKFLGSARQKCGCYGVISVEAVIKRAVGGPLGEWTAVRRMAARNPKLSVPRAPTPPPPEVSTASENQQYTGFSKIELASITAAYRTLRPAGGVLSLTQDSEEAQLENPGLIR